MQGACSGLNINRPVTMDSSSLDLNQGYVLYIHFIHIYLYTMCSTNRLYKLASESLCVGIMIHGLVSRLWEVRFI